MSERIKLVPNSEHPIAITPNPACVTIRVNGQIVAQTNRALTLIEAGYPPVQYVPAGDVRMAALEPTERTTYCPYKGDCSYFSIPAGGDRSINAVWSYGEPFDAVRTIAGYLAFYPDRVDAIEESPIH